MKNSATLIRSLAIAAVLLVALSTVACTRDQVGNSTTDSTPRRRIPLAPVGVSSPGIGSPGGGSMDTRATGTLATGQGDSPVADPVPGSVPVSAAGNSPGAGRGSRF